MTESILSKTERLLASLAHSSTAKGLSYVARRPVRRSISTGAGGAVVTDFDLTEKLIADFGCIEPVYVDGVAGLLNWGTNFATLYFRWT